MKVKPLTNTANTQDWLEVSRGIVISAYLEPQPPILLRGEHPFTEGSENLSNAAPFSDLVHHDPDSITEAMNAVCEDLDTRPDPALAAAAHRTLARSEW